MLFFYMMKPSVGMLQEISIDTNVSQNRANQYECPRFVSPTISQGVGRTEFLHVYLTIAVTLILIRESNVFSE